ncbi:GTPase IMAP family member 8-like [Pholidichthys leucotaenia]
MDPDLTIVLLGKSGGGKSASGNTIFGRPVFESKMSFRPVTTEITEKTGEVFGRKIRVIDTPGILDFPETEEEVKTFCQSLIQSFRPVLFLVVIRVGRFTREDQEAVEASIRVLGDQGIKKAYLLFTFGDKLKWMTLYDFIFEDNEGSLPAAVMKFSGQYHLFNNEDDNEEQVRKLLLKAGYLTTSVPDEPVNLKERRIVLIGRPGAGKSSSGNTILGSEEFKSAGGFNSVSTESVCESAVVEGCHVSVVDTPGFTDKDLTVDHLNKMITDMIIQAAPGPHAFVIVVKIDRISQADEKMFAIITSLFGEDASKFTMVIFTHGDKVKGQPIDELIQSNKPVSDLVSKCGGRFCVFDNNKTGNRRQVREFLTKVDEMVTANGGQRCSSDMIRMAETFIREEKRISEEEQWNFSSGSDRNQRGSPTYRDNREPKTEKTFPDEPGNLKEKKIVLIGQSGAGKSSSGNTILGSRKFTSSGGFNLVSTESVCESAVVEGCQVSVVDTPGFTDKDLTVDSLNKMITDMFIQAAPGPHAFVVVVKIDRISQADEKMFEIITSLFGEDASKFTMVIFTHGDKVKDQTIDGLIQSNKPVSELVSKCGGRFCEFDNNETGDRSESF